MANIQQVSFTAPSDADAERKKLERSRRMAEILQQQAMEPQAAGQMVGGHFVAASPLAGIAKILQGYTSGKMLEDTDKQEAELTKRSNDMLVEGLNNYQKALQGTPAQATEIVDDEYGPQTVTAPATPGNRQEALAQLLRSGHPILQQFGMQQMFAKPESPFGKIDPKDYTQESVQRFAVTNNFADLVPARKREFVNGQAVDPYSTGIGTVIPKQADPASDLLIPDGKGGYIPNAPLVDVKKGIARAGATNVSVKTDVKTGESLANQVGPMMKDSTAAAEGAVKQVDAAQRIVKAVNTNKLFAGPGATTRMRVGQIADAFGITGKDEKEKIENTRQTIRGLAELTLQGRQQMRGQGAITESESALAERAMSGDIDDLTPAEIKLLAKASERAARHQHAEHQRKLKVMQQNPGLQGVAPFYQGPEMPPELSDAPAAPAAAPTNNGWSIRQR